MFCVVSHVPSHIHIGEAFLYAAVLDDNGDLIEETVWDGQTWNIDGKKMMLMPTVQAAAISKTLRNLWKSKQEKPPADQ